MNRIPKLTQTDIHLTDEQMFALLDQASNDDRHLATCAECQSEFAALRDSFTNFRAATTSLAAAEALTLASRAPSVPVPRHFRRQIWAASFATVAVLFTVSVSVFRPHHQVAVTPVVAPDPAVTVSDEALLDGIQADLSTSIPPSLQPLAVPAATTQTNF